MQAGMKVEVTDGPYCPMTGTVISANREWIVLRVPSEAPFFTTEITVRRKNVTPIDPLDDVEDALF